MRGKESKKRCFVLAAAVAMTVGLLMPSNVAHAETQIYAGAMEPCINSYVWAETYTSFNKDGVSVRVGDRSMGKDVQGKDMGGNEYPYLVRVGDVKVKIRFANQGITFEDAFEDMLMNI